MPRTSHTKTNPHTAHNEGSGFASRYSVLTILCGSLLVGGFFLAARQHFSSMDYGIKNSRLRKQLDELEAEKRRLLLTREISLSPSELMKAARKIGFTQTSASEPRVVLVSQEIKAAPAKLKVEKNDVIKKTVISKPVQKALPQTAPRPEKLERQAKKESVAKDGKHKS